MGYSRQYFYKHCKQKEFNDTIGLEVKKLLDRERKILPRLGGRKLHHLIKDQLGTKEIKMGRDKLFYLLKKYDMLISPPRRYIQTTMSKHWLRKYPNIVKNIFVDRPDQIWVSDITYLKTDQGNCYLNLVTDAYSRKIVGYAIADNMETSQMKQALQMAIKNRKGNNLELIHHSDRGLQYCSNEYVTLAEKNQIKMSMTENGDPYENALAERMNRTLKEEFGLGQIIATKTQAKILVEQAVDIYNNYRPHLSLKMQTPNSVYKQKSQLFA